LETTLVRKIKRNIRVIRKQNVTIAGIRRAQQNTLEETDYASWTWKYIIVNDDPVMLMISTSMSMHSRLSTTQGPRHLTEIIAATSS